MSNFTWNENEKGTLISPFLLDIWLIFPSRKMFNIDDIDAYYVWASSSRYMKNVSTTLDWSVTLVTKEHSFATFSQRFCLLLHFWLSTSYYCIPGLFWYFFHTPEHYWVISYCRESILPVTVNFFFLLHSSLALDINFQLLVLRHFDRITFYR